MPTHWQNTIGLTIDLPSTDTTTRLSHPKHKAELIPWEEMSTLNKLIKGLEKEKMILGWHFWYPCRKISVLQMIGRLVHHKIIMPYTHHVLRWLRDLLSCSNGPQHKESIQRIIKLIFCMQVLQVSQNPSQSAQRKTDILCIQNIWFLLDGVILDGSVGRSIKKVINATNFWL